MTAKLLKEKYINFFVARNHKLLPNVNLVPKDDPTTLFISAGMQPLVPYLLGQPHPLGKRLVSNQRCVRTVDIEGVGDTTHLTFFEMLGNWSLGDYFKKESLAWSLEFVTQELGLARELLTVTIFKGDGKVPFDQESKDVWLSLGIPEEKIYPLPREDNWWEASGSNVPGGPDSEIFYDTGQPACGQNCQPGCNCGKYIEIWNNVFMEFEKNAEGEYLPLLQKNVDTGMGVERTLAVLNGKSDAFETEGFVPIIQTLQALSGKSYDEEKNKKPLRIMADHLRAAVFLIADGVTPSNLEQGYVLRRLIRRAIRFGHTLDIHSYFTDQIADVIIKICQNSYPHLSKNRENILIELGTEEKTFGETLERGVKKVKKLINTAQNGVISGAETFKLYETYGFPLELIQEMAVEQGARVDEIGFERAKKAHQEKSRASVRKRFVGGLADKSITAMRLHTATHLLQQALRDVLGTKVAQKGSQITSERLRFDFNCDQKLTSKELVAVENLVNEKIRENLPIKVSLMSLPEALKVGALALFGEKYPSQVKVYSIGDFSKEVCAGPHAASTGELGHFKIIKQEAVGKGMRRIKAVLI